MLNSGGLMVGSALRTGGVAFVGHVVVGQTNEDGLYLNPPVP